MITTRRVRVLLDGERATAELLGAPNAIGVCKLRVVGQEIRRYVAHIEPLDDDAKQLLASGSRFVALDPEVVLAQAQDTASVDAVLRERTVDDVVLLKHYAVAALLEAQAVSRKQRRDMKRIQKITVAVGVIKEWIARARMRVTSSEAGLTDEQARNPRCLLEKARTEILGMWKKLHDRGASYEELHESKKLAETIGNYLVHHADPGSIDGGHDKSR